MGGDGRVVRTGDLQPSKEARFVTGWISRRNNLPPGTLLVLEGEDLRAVSDTEYEPASDRILGVTLGGLAEGPPIGVLPIFGDPVEGAGFLLLPSHVGGLLTGDGRIDAWTARAVILSECLRVEVEDEAPRPRWLDSWLAVIHEIRELTRTTCKALLQDHDRLSEPSRFLIKEIAWSHSITPELLIQAVRSFPDSPAQANKADEAELSSHHAETDIVLDPVDHAVLSFLNRQPTSRTRRYIADNLPRDYTAVRDATKRLIEARLVEDRGGNKGVAPSRLGQDWIRRHGHFDDNT